MISDQARAAIERHVEAMRQQGSKIFRLDLPKVTEHGFFVAPTVIEIDRLEILQREIFGPVLHVLRYPSSGRPNLLRELGATGYALTFGVHSRIEESIAEICALAPAGNIYVNRSMIGAVVGVQPFGGHGLSGTGPKAGGPLILPRLLADMPEKGGRRFSWTTPIAKPNPAAKAWCDWLSQSGWTDAAARCSTYLECSKLGFETELPGPVGESNIYRLEAQGAVLCLPASRFGLLLQVGAALATGNRVVMHATDSLRSILATMPASLAELVTLVGDWSASSFDAVLLEGDCDRLMSVAQQLAAGSGAIVGIQNVSSTELAGQSRDYRLDRLLRERSISINTAAAGGNASLMTIG